MAEWALHCFKAYDIRGIAYDELDEKFAERLGKALGTFLDASNIAVGRDIRESSPSLHSAFVSGLTQAGVNVHDLGIVHAYLYLNQDVQRNNTLEKYHDD